LGGKKLAQIRGELAPKKGKRERIRGDAGRGEGRWPLGGGKDCLRERRRVTWQEISPGEGEDQCKGKESNSREDLTEEKNIGERNSARRAYRRIPRERHKGNGGYQRIRSPPVISQSKACARGSELAKNL